MTSLGAQKTFKAGKSQGPAQHGKGLLPTPPGILMPCDMFQQSANLMATYQQMPMYVPCEWEWTQAEHLAWQSLQTAAHTEQCIELKKMRHLSNDTCSTAEGQSSDADDGKSSQGNDDSAAGSSKPPSEAADAEKGQRSLFIHDVDRALASLDSTDAQKTQVALDWISQHFWSLAFNKKGCRVLQKAIDVGSPVYRQQLLLNLRGYVEDALKSPHANYVLQKFIQVVTPEQVQFIVEELKENASSFARHRFGCRILQRLLEYGAPCHTEYMIDNIVADAAPLCRDINGTFIMQHILKYGSPTQRTTVATVLHADIMRFAKHRCASHVVICALAHCSREDVQKLLDALTHDSEALDELSHREYGSFVVREVKRAAAHLRGGKLQAAKSVNIE